MADDPANPGAPAILLYREVITFDTKASETEYRRIKILTDAGKKYADIEIPYFENRTKIEDIRARTTRPDGTSTEFRGQIFDRIVLKGRKIRVLVKAFTLPDIQEGSIIEYSYTSRFHQKPPDVLKNPKNYIISETLVYPGANWTVQEELFTRRARFVAYPFKTAPFYWAMRSLPDSIRPNRQQDGSSVVEVQNVPGFQEEELMPPQNSLMSSLTCFYVLGPQISGYYWDSQAKAYATELKSFIGDPGKLRHVLASIFSQQDSPEVQLRKLYSRVQKIRYLSYEPSKSGRELERQSIKENKNVEDVLKHDYAYANEINLVLVALARAAGFESAPMLVTSRDITLFESNLPDPTQLNSMVVWVRAGGKDYFLDPATRFCPFESLPWAESATKGILITEGMFPFRESADPKFMSIVNTPPLTSKGAAVKTAATLNMGSDGAVDGSVVVSFVGQEALERRLSARNMDNTGRKKLLEDEIKGWVSSAAKVELNTPVNWDESDQPLRATFDLKIPDFATATGRRLLFRAGIFEKSVKSFEAGTRTHPVYFPYPFQEADEITLTLPPEYAIGSLPEKRKLDTQFGTYLISFEAKDGIIQIARHFASESVYVPLTHYASLRAYFNQARQTDENQIVLEAQRPRDAK